jgi:hypothetical protein
METWPNEGGRTCAEVVRRQLLDAGASRCRSDRWRRLFEQSPALLRCQPIPEAHADAPHTLHAANAGRQLGTEETRVGRFIRPRDGLRLAEG